ncbi:uncharacterized protein [Dermacentor albipictus]|uniref:uncharacterized protein n=1 Tax=Dermacentor albipictus TaxID=60249 RepID=UPI0031FCF848
MPIPRAHAAHVSRIEVVEMEAEQKRRLAAMALALCVDEEDYYPAPKRSCWVKDWMCRKELGLQSQLFKELVVSDPSEYRRLLRVSREQFAELLARVGPRIERKTTVMRQPIQPATKLQATLRYLASGDAGVWQTTPLQEALEGNKANLPDHVEVGPGLFLPPVFVADDAFPIGKNLMKPYGGSSLSGGQRIFNYRLSRARRVVENAFGILANRFRFLLTTINAEPERVVPMVKAACVLHNYLGNDMSTFPDSGPEDSREQKFFGLRATRGRGNAFGARVREDMRDYFSGQGAVPWQRASAYVDEYE